MGEKLFKTVATNEAMAERGMTDEKGVIVDQEMIEECRRFTEEIIPILESYDESVVATCLGALLGQNIAFVVKHSDVLLETLVDRVTLAVRTSAERELADDNSDGNESHRVS